MGFFEKGNPISVFVYFMAAALGAMFCMHPAVVALSLLGGIGTYFALGGRGGIKAHGLPAAIFVLGTLLNLAFNHSGETVLIFINDNPVTLEALVYGAVSSGAIVGVIYWFRAFSLVMTGDRLLYVFGAFSPKLALMLSMALRYIPLFSLQAEKISQAQRAVGADGQDSLLDRLRSKLRVFWVMVTWTLENGIITADSMEARGYGGGKRSFFALYRFRLPDTLVLAATLFLGAWFCGAFVFGTLGFEFYPSLNIGETSWLSWVGILAYGILTALPCAIRMGEEIKWRSLRSEI